MTSEESSEESFVEFLINKSYTELYENIILHYLEKYDSFKMPKDTFIKFIEDIYNKYYSQYPPLNTNYIMSFWNYFWKENFNIFFRKDGEELINKLINYIVNDNKVYFRYHLETKYKENNFVYKEYMVFYKIYTNVIEDNK
jgi:hypothetical protein